MRAALIVLDSVGVGDAPDAAQYGDEGANTLGHLLDRDPQLPRQLSTLWSLGLGQILGRDPVHAPTASFGRMIEASAGKDSTTGHWELAGVVISEPFGLFEHFPPQLVQSIERDARVRFIGNLPASGTAIIEQLGPEHLCSGNPILYTSADSVLQIAAHEEVIPLPRLYEICRIARRHSDRYRIGRVIARPFVGSPGTFVRTSGRHDFSIAPPRTILDALLESDCPVQSIGKIADLFAGQGISQSHPTASNEQGMSAIETVWSQTTRGLVFGNLVDFDTVYGHRRDPAGYTAALVSFDRWLAGFLHQVRDEDLLIITADHGNDPTFRGTDHTREQVPLLVRYSSRAANLGTRKTFADIAATLARYFGLPAWPAGSPLFDEFAQSAQAPSGPLDFKRQPADNSFGLRR
jgi:phosphopentomutase